MNSIFRPVAKFLLAVSVAYLGLTLLFALKSPLPFEVMDTNDDGLVLLSEAMDANDVGKRQMEIDGQTCAEWFWYKDGTEAWTECPTTNDAL